MELLLGYCKNSCIIVKMADELPASNQDVAAEHPPAADVPASNEPAAETVSESHDTQTSSAPKRKGRPPGAKDAVKRVRKPPVHIRVEPIIAAEPVVEPRLKAEPKVETKQTIEIEEDPPTPRTLLREASRHYVSLRGLVHANKKTEVSNMYTKKLTSWPV